MATIDFFLDKTKYKIQCPQDQKDKIIELSKKVNSKISRISKNIVNADEKTLLAICCLTIEDELQTLRKKNNNKIDENDEEEKTTQNLLEDHIESMESINKKIEILIKKIDEF